MHAYRCPYILTFYTCIILLCEHIINILNFKIVTTCGIHGMGVNVGLSTLTFTWFIMMIVVFADWRPSAKVYTRENSDQVLVQWENMAVHEYENVKIAKSQNPRNRHPMKIKVYNYGIC